MPDTVTPFLSLTLPEVGASPDSWGTKINAALTSLDSAVNAILGRASVWGTYSGTPNAVTVTLARTPTAYQPGFQVRFRAGAKNTGATTLRVGSLPILPCLTVTGALLPPDYIRTDADTVATLDAAGTTWYLDREPEAGGSAGSTFLRLANGVQQCTISSVETARTTTGPVATQVTYARPFARVDARIATQNGTVTTVGVVQNINADSDSSSLTTANVNIDRASGTATFFHLVAIGVWYL